MVKTTIGMTADEITANEGLKIAFGMALWGFGADESRQTGVLTSDTCPAATCDLTN